LLRIIDHHLLELPHVRALQAHVPAYDWWLLALGGVLLIVIGWLMSRTTDTRRGVTDAEGVR
jgi:uncharacterized membrane protein